MRRAFSLIEVLLAILILALGLLGLGAVIPVIVKQQRNASDATLGVSAAKAAQSYLLSRPEFSETSTSPINAWDHLLADSQNWSPTTPTGPGMYIWQPWSATSNRCFIDLDSGNLEFAATTTGLLPIQLLVTDRLWPTKSGQPVQNLGIGEDPYRPQFVWDFIGRRLFSKTGLPQSIQVAVFVRRIDLNIKVPRVIPVANAVPITLLDVLTPLGPTSPTAMTDSDICVPVAVMTENNPVPTNRGNNVPTDRTYANFLSLNATFDGSTAAKRSRIMLSKQGTISFPASGNADTLLTLASQPGQKLLDSFGNVYTVQRVDETAASSRGGVTVVVDPPVPASVPDPNTQPTSVQPHEKFRQVIFTPQIPGAVHVFTVTRPVK